MTVAILWAVSLLALLACVCVSGILSLVYKDKMRLRAIDTLLVSATLLIAVFLMAGSLPKESFKHGLKPKAPSEEDVINNIGADGKSLRQISYLSSEKDLFTSFVLFESRTTMGQELKEVEDDLTSNRKKPFAFDVITADLAIVLHAQNKDVSALFTDINDRANDAKFLESIRSLYTDPDKSEAGIENYKTQIEKDMPKGWFRDEALLTVYKLGDPAKLDQFLRQREEATKLFLHGLQLHYALRAILATIGFIAVIFYFKNWKTLPKPIPMTSNFRRMYGCAISALFGEVILGGVFGVMLGVYEAVSKTMPDLASQQFAMTVTLVIAGAIASLVAYYFIICRPQGVSLWAPFTRSAERLTKLQILAYSWGGATVLLLCSILAHLVMHFVTQSHGSPNHVQVELSKALYSSNVPIICWTMFLACVFAPLTEEILFRGLLYGWVRDKFGIPPALVVSSLVFAAFHLDLHGFLHYFALGVVLAAVYERTRNLWITIAIHGLWNAWAMGTTWYLTTL